MARLSASIDDLGFFSGITARKLDDGTYEIAAGHHRWEAAKQADPPLEYVEAIVDTYTDEEMVRIMAIENLTQRGANSGAQMDAVAAMARIVSKELLSDRTKVSRIHETYNLITNQALGATRGKILNDGPGELLLYQAINGFARDEAVERKADDPKSEMISQHDVKNAVKRLKDSGIMAKLVAKAFAEVEAERVEDEAKRREVEAKADAKAKAEEERLQAEEERKERKKREEEEERKKREEKEERKLKDEGERKKREEERKKREAKEEQERNERKAKFEKDRKEREHKEEQERKKRNEERKEREDKEADERRRVKEQQEKERVYDIRCDEVFKDPAYTAVFFKAVTARGSLEAIPRDKQLEIAKDIMKGMAGYGDHRAGTAYINQYINDYLTELDQAQKASDAERRRAMEVVQARLRVDTLWNRVKSGISLIDQSMVKLVEENRNWNREVDGDFPVNPDITMTYGILSRLEKMMRLMYGGSMGIPQASAEDLNDPSIKMISHQKGEAA